MTAPDYAEIQRSLFPDGMDGWTKVFAIVDGARDPRIYGAVDASRAEKCCLYSVHPDWDGSDLPWQLLMNGPYLVELDPQERFTRDLLRNGWKDHWGIFFRSGSNMQKLRRHFRDLLVVRSEAGARLMFRYYDPRVLRVYLPSCQPPELRTFFGPVDIFIVPGENPKTADFFRMDGASLDRREAQLS